MRRNINDVIVIIKLNNLWWWRELSSVIQISVVCRLFSKLGPIWFVGVVKRRRISCVRNMALEEHPRHLCRKLGLNHHRSRIEVH